MAKTKTDAGSSEWIDFRALDTAPEETVARLARINLADLIGTMELHPALYGYAAASFERAKVFEIQTKAEIDRVRAEAFMKIAQSDPSLPVNRLERMVEQHEAVRGAINSYHGAVSRAGSLKALVNALEHRRDMIIQIASRQKREFQNS